MLANEIVGLIGTLFVLLSFLMKDIRIVRLVNIMGAIFLVIYGILINAISTWLLNGVLIIVHLVYLTLDLIKLSKDKKQNKLESTTDSVDK